MRFSLKLDKFSYDQCTNSNKVVVTFAKFSIKGFPDAASLPAEAVAYPTLSTQHLVSNV